MVCILLCCVVLCSASVCVALWNVAIKMATHRTFFCHVCNNGLLTSRPNMDVSIVE